MYADRDDRAEILMIASALTSNRHDATAVVEMGALLAAWVEDAPTQGDLISRMEALRQHRRNTAAEGGSLVDQVVDDPQRFLAGAKVLYGFAVANDAAIDVPDWPDDGDPEEI